MTINLMTVFDNNYNY